MGGLLPLRRFPISGPIAPTPEGSRFRRLEVTFSMAIGRGGDRKVALDCGCLPSVFRPGRGADAPRPAAIRFLMASQPVPASASSPRRRPLRAAARTRPREQRESRQQFADLRGVVMRVRVQGGATRERVALYRDGTLRAWVQVEAQQGRDNLRLQWLLGRLTGTPAGRIEILTGSRTPWKLVRIPGISRRQLASRIPKRRGGYRFADRPRRAARRPD